MSLDSDTTLRYRLRGAPIIHDTIDNETIAINQLTGAYYSLEGPAALAWQLLAEGATPSELADRLESAYSIDGVALESVVRQFVDELLDEELIVAVGVGGPEADPSVPSAPPDGAANGSRPALRELRLQRYTDLEVMLLADPIHEVDETGWPMPLADRG